MQGRGSRPDCRWGLGNAALLSTVISGGDGWLKGDRRARIDLKDLFLNAL